MSARISITEEEARAGVMPDAPGLYTVRPDMPIEYLAEYRMFRLWNEQWSEIYDFEVSDLEVRRAVREYGWPLHRLAPEQVIR